MWQASARRNPRTVERAIRDLVGTRADEAREKIEDILRQDIGMLIEAPSKDAVCTVMDFLQERMQAAERAAKHEKAEAELWELRQAMAKESMEKLLTTMRGMRNNLANLLRKALFLGPKD